MAMRVVSAAALSAIAMFVWGFVFWGPVLNMSAKLMAPLPAAAERDLLPPLRATQTPDGMYIYPGPMAESGDEAAEAEWRKKLAEGPRFHLAYHRSGTSPMDPAMMVKGFVLGFVVAVLGAAVLAMGGNALSSYSSRVALLTLVSLIAAIWTNVGNVIWWFHTPRYAAGQVAYTLGAGVLMALITAAIVRPRSAA